MIFPWRARMTVISAITGLVCLGDAPQTAMARDVVDMKGQRVSVSEHPERIADLWFAHNEVVAMLGAADRIRVTVDKPANEPWLFKLDPALAHARYVTPSSANPEGLLADRVDVAFVSDGLTSSDSLRAAGLPVMDMSFRDAEGLLRSVALTADVLNNDTARTRATQYETALKAQLAALGEALTDIPDAKRPKVLHLASLSPLTVDGGGTMIDQWITRAGGRNVAADVTGNKKPVTMEQLHVWDPDIIIVQGGVPVPITAAGAPAGWGMLRAVADKKVYANPVGAFPWDRYGSEFLLQLRWAAKLLHPDVFRDYQLETDCLAFYKDFFGAELSRADVALILAGRPPEN